MKEYTHNTFSPLWKLAAVAVALGLSSVSRADTVTIKASPYPGGLGGGEFTDVSSSPLLNTAAYSPLALVNGGFETFCLEYKENVQPGSTYDFTISNGAKSGDVASGFDPLSLGSAWLYHQFASGSLSGYDYLTTSGRKASALSLQLAFWYLEDETQLISGYKTWNGSGNIFLNQVATQFGSLAAAKGDAANGYLGVYVINPTKTTVPTTGGQPVTTNIQSQLYFVPENGPTLALIGAALLGLAVIYRRRQVA